MDCRDRPGNDVLRFGAILLSKRHHPRARALYASEHSSALAKKHEGAGALLQRIKPFVASLARGRRFAALQLGGFALRAVLPGTRALLLPGGLRLPGHRGNPPWERIKAPMRTESLRRSSIPVQPRAAAGLSCPRTVPTNVPVPCLRNTTASAEPFPAPMTPHERAPRRERVIGI